MNFNKQQTEALETKIDQDVLISAGAGSGKTRVLTEKVYKVIHDDGVSPSSLLVLTFTNKAAFEMKERIIKKFEDESETGDVDANLIDEIQSAHIQTFDSFSLYLVKKYAKQLGMPSTVNIINEDICNVKKNEYVNDIFLKHYREKDQAFLRTLEKFNFRDDSITRKVVIDLDDRLSNMIPEDRKEFVENYDKYLTEEFLDSCLEKYVDVLKDEIRKGMKQAYYADMYYDEYADEAHRDRFTQRLASSSRIDSDDYLFNDLSSYCIKSNTVYNILKGMLSMNADDFIAEAKRLNKTGTVPNITKTDGTSEEERNHDKKLYNDFLKYFVVKTDGKLATLYDYKDKETELEKLNSFKDDLKVLFALCDELDGMLEDYKLLTNSYTFSDIALKALSLMTEEKYKDVADEIKDTYKYVMVDEYQDTNDIQESFLNALSERATLFAVGDVKQSIYAFRNANCQLILDREKNYTEAHDGKHKVVHMNTNYRSVEKMLKDINLIFMNYMTEDHGGVNYDKHQSLVYDKESDLYGCRSDKSDYGIKILEVADSNLEHSVPESQARAIATDIRNKVDSGYLVIDKGELRPCTYKDFAVIARRKLNFSLYGEVFEEYRIPFNIREKQGISDIDVIAVIQSLLTLMSSIDSYRKAGTRTENEKHLFVSIARSYLYGKEAGYDDQRIYDILHDSNPNPYYSDPIYVKVKNFTYAESEKPISQIFLDLIEEFGIIKKLPTMGNIESNITSIDSLYSMILSEEMLGEGVSDFIELLKNVNKFSLSLEIEAETNLDDAVELITIHGSKGLEYNIVYMPAYDNSLSKNGGSNDKPDYTFSKEYGLILPDYQASVDEEGKFDLNVRYGLLKTIYDKTEGGKDEDINEFVRYYYVALTRAKECCYIVGEHKGKDNKYYCTLADMLSHTGYYHRLKEFVTEEYPSVQVKEENGNMQTIDIKAIADEIESVNTQIENCEFEASKITSLFAQDMYSNTIYKPLQTEVDKKIQEIKNALDEYWRAHPDDKHANEKIYRTDYPKFEARLICVEETNGAKESNQQSLPAFVTDDSGIEAKPFEMRRASKTSDEDEEPDQYILDLGTRMHRYMELTDFGTKDTSFIENEKERKIIDKALQAPFFDDLENAKTYSEYGYYDEEFKTSGYIDLLLVKTDEIVIIDYKLKHIDDEAYTDQLHTYKRNIEKIFGTERPVNCYLLSLTTGEYSKVE